MLIVIAMEFQIRARRLLRISVPVGSSLFLTFVEIWARARAMLQEIVVYSSRSVRMLKKKLSDYSKYCSTNATSTNTCKAFLINLILSLGIFSGYED